MVSKQAIIERELELSGYIRLHWGLWSDRDGTLYLNHKTAYARHCGQPFWYWYFHTPTYHP